MTNSILGSDLWTKASDNTRSKVSGLIHNMLSKTQNHRCAGRNIAKMVCEMWGYNRPTLVFINTFSSFTRSATILASFIDRTSGRAKQHVAPTARQTDAGTVVCVVSLRRHVSVSSTWLRKQEHEGANQEPQESRLRDVSTV